MSMIETEETNQFTFEPFAAHTFYTEINRSLVQRALAPLMTSRAGKQFTIVDMACGTGAITRLIAEEIRRHGRQAHIIGVDPSALALHHARQGMQEMGEKGRGVTADFIQGETSDLPSLVQHADVAFFCNAIHLLPDKLSAFRLVASILAPGGIFACNSAFYQGAYVEGTERFYRLWTRRAVGWLRKEHPEVQLSREKPTAMQWITPDEYIDLFKRSGFDGVDASQECAIMTLDSYRDIGHYWLFIEGALPGVPLALGAEALGITVYQAGEELGITDIPRNWLQLIAYK